jgi:SpoVK/Ycf46/Vps4 family AAA+-type ATPase
MSEPAIIQSLRAAVEISPDNLPLRRHFADMLLQHQLWAEAEVEFRAALHLGKPSVVLRSGLATALYQQGKFSAALAEIAAILQQRDEPISAPLYLLHARLLVQSGDLPRAIGEYLRALDADANLSDPQLAAQLGLLPDSSELPTPPAAIAPPPPAAPTTPTHPPPIPPTPSWPSTEDVAQSKGQEEKDEEDEWDRLMKVSASGEVMGPEEGEGWQSDLERPTITFREVGGMEPVKNEIRLKIIHPLEHPELYRAYGKGIGGGILLYGPPGCGKTHLARATAGEVRAKFISVGINDILDMYLGNSERNLHQLFELARRNKPCVLFFDEVDALGASRTDMRQSSGRHLINQFLAELDGIDSTNSGILILAATNAPWHLDAAFRRPGRFDRIIFVPPPDAGARGEILRIQLQGKPTQSVDYAGLGQKLKELSGADLKAVVDTAVEEKLAEAITSGAPKPLTTNDLLKAAKLVKPSTKEWFMTARNYALYANDGGLYDDILKYLNLK